MESKPVIRVPNNKKMPLIIKKNNILQRKVIQIDGTSTSPVKIATFREDVLHDTTDIYFLKGEYQRMTLVNSLNVVTKCSRTIARYYTAYGTVHEKTSDSVTEVIGQEQYKTVFTALCSIIDQELKIRSILALLKEKSAVIKNEKLSDFDQNNSAPKVNTDKCCQTDETRMEQLKRKPRRRIRKKIVPYIVQDTKPETKKVKRILINIRPNNLDSSKHPSEIHSGKEASDSCDKSEIDEISKEIYDAVKELPLKRNSIDSIPDLGHLDDEYSNDSIAFSTLSETPTLPDQFTHSIINDVNNHTKDIVSSYLNFKIRLQDGTDIYVPSKPEDIFHIATKQNLDYLDDTSKKKLLTHQMTIDFKHCLMPLDDDGNLPLHVAVMNNDLELLNRQCIVLKIRGSSVDVPANGLTALKLALYQEEPCGSALTSALLGHGADPLRTDGEHRVSAHVAAERDADVLRALLHTCSKHARKILFENEDLWKPEMEKQTDDELAQTLMVHMCSRVDRQGYTPLMLASMLGLYENVRLLLEHSPLSANDRMPTSGNTALYLAVAAACNSALERGNKSTVVDHFRQTIEILLENGANPVIDNHSGTNANTLITEFNSAALSMLVANKLTQVNLKKNKISESSKHNDNFMLVKDTKGKIAVDNDDKKLKIKKEVIKEVNISGDKKLDIKKEVNLSLDKKLENKKEVKKELKPSTHKSKPVIVQNILLSPGSPKTSISDGKTTIDRKSTKNNVTNLQQIVLCGKGQKNPPMIVDNENNVDKPVFLMPTILKKTNLKRKVVHEPCVTKQAKIKK